MLSNHINLLIIAYLTKTIKLFALLDFIDCCYLSTTSIMIFWINQFIVEETFKKIQEIHAYLSFLLGGFFQRNIILFSKKLAKQLNQICIFIQPKRLEET